MAITPSIVADFQMWITFAIIIGAFSLYAIEKVSIEVTSLGVLSALMMFFHFSPVVDSHGTNTLSAETLLSGFANPALITVLALLVIGQGMVRTGVLDTAARFILGSCGPRSWVCSHAGALLRTT